VLEDQTCRSKYGFLNTTLTLRYCRITPCHSTDVTSKAALLQCDLDLGFNRIAGEILVGRPLGSPNKQKPFRDALNIALRNRPLALRRIADQLLDKAEQGDLAAAREIIDRTDGKAVQTVDQGNVTTPLLTDARLNAIAAGGLPEADLLGLPPPDGEPRN